MKKIIPAIAIAAIALAGCGASGSENTTSATSKSVEQPSTTLPRPTTTTVPQQDILIEAYVGAMRDWFGTITRTDAIDLGKTMCDTIDDYGSVSDTVDGIIASGKFRGMEGDVGYIMGVAIPVFCPEYEAEALRLFQ